MNKIEMLEYYIHWADEIVAANDIAAAKSFQNEVIAVYDSEIQNIRGQLDNYPTVFINGRTVDYIGDVRLLKAKLMNYRNNLQSGLYKELLPGGGTNISVNQEVNSTISISLEQVIETVQQIPDKDLTAEDKEILIGKLASMADAKDKTSKWEKAKGILKWLGDKGVQVGIAALPYIAQALQAGG